MERRRTSWSTRTNAAVGGMTSRVDGQTQQVAQRAVAVIVPAVRLLRLPSLALLLAPWPFLLAALWLALAAGGAGGTVVVVLVVLLAAVSLTFGLRRHRLLVAVSDPDRLATELGIAVGLSDRVEESRGVLAAIAGGGGPRVLSRLRGLWSGVGMTGRWIDGVGDLERARYLVPPRIGTTVAMTVAALWLVPVSLVLVLLTAVGALAGSL